MFLIIQIRHTGRRPCTCTHTDTGSHQDSALKPNLYWLQKKCRHSNRRFIAYRINFCNAATCKQVLILTHSFLLLHSILVVTRLMSVICFNFLSFVVHGGTSYVNDDSIFKFLFVWQNRVNHLFFAWCANSAVITTQI